MKAALLAIGLSLMTHASADPGLDAAVATFGGGCFWCMEPPYDEIDGVLSTTSGFMGGRVENPSYRQVTAGNTGHVEVVQVAYDPERVSYSQLLDVYWRNVDPLTDRRQFCDIGEMYRPVIFVHGPEQREQALASKQALIDGRRFEQPIIVPIEEASSFWPAEEYHQDYYLKNPVRYRFYRFNCGRDGRLDELWGEDR